MPSPFPGVDPYLEDPAVWPDFHFRFIAHLGNHLNERLPECYVTEIDRHVWLQEPSAEERMLIGRPDVYAGDTGPEPPAPAATATIPAPATTVVPIEPRLGDRYINVVDVADRRVVTVIELLSPSNKYPGRDRDAYLTKRREYIHARLNLVEIDWLRDGPRMPMTAPPPAQYYVLVGRAAELPKFGVWALSVREPLPTVPVPLDPGVADIPLDLQRCFTAVYDAGRYRSKIDYTRPPTPPLHEPDATWARERLAARHPPGGVTRGRGQERQ
jgi:hypothetical protein